MGKPCILIGTITAFVVFGGSLAGFIAWYYKNMLWSNTSKYGSLCDSTNELSCSSPQLICSERSTCTCASNYVPDYSNSNNVVCVQKRAYGEECPLGRFNPCSDITTACIRDVQGTYRCICVNGFYRNSTAHCSSVRDLAVFEVSTTSTTSKVILTWRAYNHGLNVGYSVSCDQGEGQLEGSVTDTGAVWSNLTAGKKYSFMITTTIPADSMYGVKQVVVNKDDVWTEAEKPGSVVLVTPLPGHLYEVTFQPSPGHVTFYSLVINDEQVRGTNTKYIFRTLYPGQNCRYAITAYNGIQNPSEISEGTFRLNKTTPGTVRSLTATEDESNNALVLTFLCPDPRDVPGNVQRYRIQKILLNPAGLPETNTSYEFAASRVSCTNAFNDGALGGVLGERTYKFMVRALNDDFVGNYSPEITFYVPPRVPKLSLDYGGFKLLQILDNSGLKNTEFKVRVCSQCLLDSSRGTVLDVGLVVCVQGNGNPCTFTGVTRLNKFSSWDDARHSDFAVPYLTTPPDWLTSVKAQPSGLNYIIGQNTSCHPSTSLPGASHPSTSLPSASHPSTSLPSASHPSTNLPGASHPSTNLPGASHPSTSYCNGPLPIGKQFTVIMVQCNVAGCGQVRYEDIFSNKEQKSNINFLAIGIVGVCVALVGIFVRFVRWVWKMRSPHIRDWLFPEAHKSNVEIVSKNGNTSHLVEAPNHSTNQDSSLLFTIQPEKDRIHLSV